MLKVEGLSKIYKDGTCALNNVSFFLQEGEFVTILGKSGAGKSTLLRCINRLVEPTEGKISLNGEEITGASRSRLRALRRKVGMIFQQYNLVKQASVRTNVLTGCLGYQPSWRGFVNRFPEQEIESAMEKLKDLGIGEKFHQRADRLSGGQQQRVGIARALMQEPKLILADEPVSSLDPGTSRTIMEILQYINRKQKVTLLCNLHLPELAREFGNRVLVLKGGRIFYDGSLADLDAEKIKDAYGSAS